MTRDESGPVGFMNYSAKMERAQFVICGLIALEGQHGTNCIEFNWYM